jgi:hypothetical protein
MENIIRVHDVDHDAPEFQDRSGVKKMRFTDDDLRKTDERWDKFNLWIEKLEPGCIFTDKQGMHYEYIGLGNQEYVYRWVFWEENVIISCDSNELFHKVDVDIEPQKINFYVAVCGEKIECNKSVIKLLLSFLGLKNGSFIVRQDENLMQWGNCHQIASVGHEQKGCFPLYSDTKATAATWAKLRWMMKDFQAKDTEL